MATKRLRPSGTWEYIVRRKGVLPKPVSLTFDTEAEGDEYVRRLEALLDRGVVPEEFSGVTARITSVGNCITEYVKAIPVPHSDEKLLNRLKDVHGSVPLATCTYVWADQWIANMKRINRHAPSTIRHYVGALSRCFDWAARRSVAGMAINPLRQLPRRYASYSEEDARISGVTKRDNARDRRLWPDEEAAIRKILAGEQPSDKQRPFITAHREHLALLFGLAIETAMRMREMYTLTGDQVDISQRTIFLDKTKNGDKRQVPLSSIATKLLSGVQGGGLIFPWWDGNVSEATLRATTAKLSAQFARVFEAAGCADFHFHDIRHEATSRLYEKTNLSDLQIGKITGHKDIRMLARYANLRGSDLATRLW